MSSDGRSALADFAMNIEDINNGKPFLQQIKEEDERDMLSNSSKVLKSRSKTKK